MAIPHETVVAMQDEGISEVDDLGDFDDASFKVVVDSLAHPRDRIPNPDPNAPPGSTIARPSYTFGAKSQKRLRIACNLVKFYDTIGRNISASGMQWNTVMKNFEKQWKALEQRRKEDPPEVPKISKALPILKWLEAMDDWMANRIGKCNIPLIYVTRDNVDVPAVCPDRANGQPHTTQHGSVKADLIARASHVDGMFSEDNESVYYASEEGTRGTQYADTIQPYKATKNGRGAMLALMTQHAGKDKWEAELKRQDELIHTRVWKGQNNYSLERFINSHRNAFISMQRCAVHVDFQLPNKHTRVGFLLEALQCSDPELRAAIAAINQDAGPTGKRNDFEAAVAFLLPTDPVAKKRNAGAKQGNAQISDTTADVAAFGAKPGIGKTGVALRYHKHKEFHALTPEQRDELVAWQKARKDPSKGKKKRNSDRSPSKLTEKSIAAAVAQELKKQRTEVDKDSVDDTDIDDEKFRAYIMSIVKEDATATSAKKVKISDASASAPGTPSKSMLNSILRRARN